VSWKDRALSASSQAGLVNNLKDALAWGLFPLLFAASGVGIEQIALLAAVYPGVWGIAQLGTGALSDRWGRKGIIVAGMWLQALALLLVVIGSGGIPPGPARWCSSDWEKHWCTRHSSLRYRTLRTRRGVHPRSPCIACGVMVATALAAC